MVSRVKASWLNIIFICVAIYSVFTLILAGLLSLRWPYVSDTALNIYKAWMVSIGKTPYRDFFDMNTPGNYLLLSVPGMIFGWGDLTFRCFDLFLLALISLFTYLWLVPVGKPGARIASILFPIWYLASGPYFSLQREFIALVPISAMIACAVRGNSTNRLSLMFPAGLFLGCAVVVKPQNGIFLIPLLILATQQGVCDHYSRVRKLILILTGVLIPPGLTLIFLASKGGLHDFIDIARNYWPLYTHMTGAHKPVRGVDRLIYLVQSTFYGIPRPKLLVAVIALFSFPINANQPKLRMPFVFFLVTSIIYPSIAGQFWYYHWVPFQYFSICVGSLLANNFPLVRPEPKPIISMAAICSLLLISTSRLSYNIVTDSTSLNKLSTPMRLNIEIPDKTSRFLLEHMIQGDTVQPLDWVGGAAHGMLKAKATMSTRFLFDFVFYHHLSSPYIQDLRRQFIAQLKTNKPRFIIEITTYKLRPTGNDTSTQFVELEEFIAGHYRKVLQEEGFIIYEYVPENQSELSRSPSVP